MRAVLSEVEQELGSISRGLLLGKEAAWDQE